MSLDYRELGRGQDPKWQKGVALVDRFIHSLQGQGLLPKRFEHSATQEVQHDVLRFSPETADKLINDGVKIYEIPVESIEDQQEQKKPFWYVVDAGKAFSSLKSRAMEVAIYPDPKNFFVPNSFNSAKQEQEILLKKDAQGLRKRLKVNDIEEILPEAPEATNVIFQHLKETDVRLLGKFFDYLYMRLNTPTNSSGSNVANVGYFVDDYGLDVGDWNAALGCSNIGAARWVVPLRE